MRRKQNTQNIAVCKKKRKLGIWKIIATFLLLATDTDTWRYKGEWAAVEVCVS